MIVEPSIEKNLKIKILVVIQFSIDLFAFDIDPMIHVNYINRQLIHYLLT